MKDAARLLRRRRKLNGMAIISAAVKEVRKVWKAIFAATTAALQGLILVTIDGDGLQAVSTNEWLVVGLSVVIAGGGVWGLTNKV